MRCLAALAVACLAGVPAFAQDAPADSPPAHVSFVEGAVVLERDGRPDASPASMPLLAGDRIRTQAGRAEILFADGSALHIDQHSVVDVQSDEVVRLLEGRMRLNIAGQGDRARGLAYRVDAPAAWVQIAEPGEYRIAVLRGEREAQVELAVLRGAAEIVNEDGRSLVQAGERAFARAGAQPSPPYVFNSAAWDAFDRWSEARRDQRLGTSAQYLPEDVRPYASTFDQYGSWRYEQVHGYVWYPRVRVDWRPYSHGRWVSLRPYGWTWIAGDPWGWPTHHYGRWGVSGGAWYWIPGRRWGAAWVSWAYAPDYVSWCPLGWNDRPVFSFVNLNINIYGRRRYDPWRAWTVVPHRYFGSGYVNVHRVAPGRLDDRTRRAFAVRDRGPEPRYAVPRASSPIRAAGIRGDYAIPRGGAPRSSAPAAARESGADARDFPAPARAPRSPGVESRSSVRSSAPVTAAPDRAVPRGAPRVDADRSPRDNRVYRPDYGVQPDAGYRRAPDRDPSSDRGADERSRAVPRQDAPPRSYERPSYERRSDDRPSYGRPSSERPSSERPSSERPSYDRPRERPAPPPRSYGDAPSPRSYGDAPSRSAPRGDAPPSYRAPERQAPSGSPRSTDRPSRPSGGDDGGSRSRGDRPSSGTASRRPRG